jgi:hypothetical protein
MDGKELPAQAKTLPQMKQPADRVSFVAGQESLMKFVSKCPA